ncbi:hypothetical protein GCM10023235_78110 [Kitasatospora terrestris]|uniref:Uncharacterized protein n=1 Tax=Kitasatospora terrestris TaxID=258051 RepID=A0ABP9ET04_9ACTN
MTAVGTAPAAADVGAWRGRLDAATARAGLWPERSPWIRTAVAALPRDRFAPALLRHWDGHAWQGVDRHTGPARWAELLYADPHAAAATQLTAVLPTSSLSAQALVVDMLDSPQVEEGMRVLEPGTSLSGWNAALLAHRTGPGAGARSRSAVRYGVARGPFWEPVQMSQSPPSQKPLTHSKITTSCALSPTSVVSTPSGAVGPARSRRPHRRR